MATSDFVNQLYSNIFGRTPSSAEINFWVGRIDLGVETSSQVALDFINSAEGVRAATVERMYQATFGRTPDLAGFKVQIGALSATTGALTLDQLAVNFANSAEFQTTYVGTGTFDASAFLTKMYTNILGRAPDTAGLAVQVAFYNSLVAQGKTPAQAQAQLLSNFSSSAEFVGNPSINFDKVVLAFAGVDGQIPVSTTAAPSAQLQQLAGIPLTTIVGVLNNGVNGDGVAGGTTALQVALTTGADAPVITSAATNINGLVDFQTTANSTLSASDSLKGSGATTLTIVTQGTTAVTDATNGASISGIGSVNLRNTTAAGSATGAVVASPAGGIMTSLDASKISGLTNVTSSGTGDVTVSNLSAGASFTISGNGTSTQGNQSFGYATASSPATLNLTGGTVAATIQTNATGPVTSPASVTLSTAATGVTINSTGAANGIGALVLSGTALTSMTINAATNFTTTGISNGFTAALTDKLTVTGAGSVSLGALPGSLDLVDASTLTGGVTATLATSTLGFKGGLGNDVITSAAVTGVAGSIDAGTGTDRLVIAAATDVDTAAKVAKFSGFDVIQSAGQTVDLALFNGSSNTITALRTSGVTTFNNVNATQAAAVTVTASATPTINVLNATQSGQIDTVNMALTAGITLTTPVLSGVENLNLTVSGTSATVTTIAAFNMDALTSLTIKGAGTGGVSLTTGTGASQVNATIDAGTFTGAVTIDASGDTGNGLKIVGTTSAGVNTITGTVNADTISGGAGADVFDGKGGADVITGGGGLDIFKFTSTPATSAVNAAAPTITDFVVGTTLATSEVVQVQAAALAASAYSATAQGALVFQSVVKDAGAAVASNAAEVVKLTTAVAGAGLSSQAIFNAAIGTGTVTGLTASKDYIVVAYDSSAGRAIIFDVLDTGTTTTVLETGDVAKVIGYVTMTAADYANLGTNHFAII